MQNKIKNQEGETIKAGCVVIQGDRVLLVADKAKEVWTFPKGHVELNETLEDTAVRETHEETGYTVKLLNRLPDLVYVNKKTGEPIRVAMFLAKTQEFLDKGEEFSEWIELERAKKILYPNLRQYIDHALE